MAEAVSRCEHRGMSSFVRLFTVALLSCSVAAAQVRTVAADDRAEECTIGVACGTATVDGRPLLWKNRDAHKPDNVAMALADGKVPYFALCDAGSSEVAWGGANVAGFCIVNAVVQDLPAGADQGPNNGAFLKMALQECTSVADFDALLLRTNPTGRRTRATYGVVDAVGGAAMFEVGNTTFTRYDADKGERGILVRTNFAVSIGGERGRERYTRAEELCRAPQAKPLTARFLLQQLLRDIKAPPSAVKGERGRLDARETIHRQTTVAALVLHGVKPGVDAKWTTMWAVLGQPLFGVAVPLFPAAGGVPLAVAGDPKSAICDESRRLAAAFYVAAEAGAEPVAEPAKEADTEPAADGGDQKQRLQSDDPGPLRWLRTDTMPVARRSVLFAEADVLARYEEAVAVWSKQPAPAPSPAALRAFQDAMAKLVLRQLRELADEHAATGAGK